MANDGSPIEQIDSETADREASLPGYDILTYPADFTLEGIALPSKLDF